MRFPRFAWGVLLVNLFVILWGAVVRATGSGAGCGRHWPLCDGQVLPVAPAAATRIELFHRLSSGVALLLVALLWWASRRAFPARHPARRAARWSLGFIIVEALIGAGLVLFELTGSNDSLARAGYLAVHLVNTFLLLGALALTAHWAGATRPVPGARTAGGDAAPRWLAGGLLALLLVGMTGAVTALGDTLFPAASLREGFAADRAPTAHLLVRLRVIHPLLAVVGVLYLGTMVWRVGLLRPNAGGGRLLLGLAGAQLAVGATNLLLLAPTALQLVHLFVADLLWIAAVLFTARALAAPATGPLSARAAAAALPEQAPGRS
jgi:heme A synthase